MSAVLSAQEVVDTLLYRQYRDARAYGIKVSTLAYFFGEVPAEAMERRYLAEVAKPDDAILCWPEGK
jgi:hypothetical protein